MSTQKYRLLFILVVIGVGVTGAVLFRSGDQITDEEAESANESHLAQVQDLVKPTALEVTSPFLNVAPDVAYVGSESCLECHEEEHASHSVTAHRKALRETIAEHEPESTEFLHEASQRWYKVYRDGDHLHHQESVRDSAGNELVLNDLPMNHTMGSGRFSLSYLFEDDGFWIESPVTWYASQSKWRMSPGFDRSNHGGFSRLAEAGCVVCHAGRVESKQGNSFQPHVLEMSIGCESCHGPGEIHVAQRREGKDFDTGVDYTIVNPIHLSRELNEAVCATCHLRGEATVLRTGRNVNDFRPGMKLSDVRVDYGLKSPSGDMEVVGHVEQMHQSKCYQSSQTMTCTSCHDPHSNPSEESRIEYFRNACLDCHETDSCGIAEPERLKVHSDDNCVACHMPQTDTDIPHFAFTHHRIGIHNSEDPEESSAAGSGQLIPFLDISELPLKEIDHLLGLAYIEFAEKNPEHYPIYMERARNLLDAQSGEGLAALARISWESQSPVAGDLAQQALQSQSLSSRSRANVLVVLTDLSLRSRAWEQAVEFAQEIVKLRRHSGYWELLAQAQMGSGSPEAALESLEKAIQISPERVELRNILLDFYQQNGDEEKAAEQARAIKILNSVYAEPNPN